MKLPLHSFGAWGLSQSHTLLKRTKPAHQHSFLLQMFSCFHLNPKSNTKTLMQHEIPHRSFSPRVRGSTRTFSIFTSINSILQQFILIVHQLLRPLKNPDDCWMRFSGCLQLIPLFMLETSAETMRNGKHSPFSIGTHENNSFRVAVLRFDEGQFLPLADFSSAI